MPETLFKDRYQSYTSGGIAEALVDGYGKIFKKGGNCMNKTLHSFKFEIIIIENGCESARA